MSKDEYEDDEKPWARGRGRRDEDDEDDKPRRRRRDDDDDEDDYDDRPRRRRGKADGSNPMAVVGLVLGCLSIIGGCLTGVPAVICSVVALQKPAGKGLAVAGLVLGGLGTFWTILLVGLLLPAVTKVREAAGRANDSNNLKQIALGVHNFHDANGTYPPAAGEVSWRVHLLPYVEQPDLYQRFNLKEPWNGPTNRRLADTRVPTYVSALDPKDSADTRYRTFVGPGTLYEPGKKPLRIVEVTDGTSNTLFAVESADTVPWPQPRELDFNQNGPMPALGHPDRSTVLLVMLDGSVRSVDKKRLDPMLLKALVTPAGNERIGDW